MLPKAGVFAHAQALVVARRIAAQISGTSPEDNFRGDGYCMLEAGEHLAGFAFGNFLTKPAPEVKLRQIGRTWHTGKVMFEKWWLAPPGLRRELWRLGITLGARTLGITVAL